MATDVDITLGNRTVSPKRTIKLNVNEWFGPTIQGEGRQAGQLASFLRLTGCNLSCSWCDSPYTWDWTRFNQSDETHKMTPEEVVSEVSKLPGRLIITGGEPLMQATGLSQLLPLLGDRPIDLETNGTRPLRGTAGFWSNISCSPKIIPSADQVGSAVSVEVQPEILEVADFKFVVQDQADLDAVDAWVETHDVARSRIFLMPEGTDADTITSRTPWIMEACTQRHYNFSTRMHVYGWGDKRGH